MKKQQPSPISEAAVKVVQAQLEAYNAHDLEGWVATYSAEAEQFLLHAGSLARGHIAIRQRMVERFKDLFLHAELLHRTCIENVVVDHELVTRMFPEGLASVEMICIYEVQEDKIVKATFAIGQSRPLDQTAVE